MPNNTDRILRRVDFLTDFNHYWVGTIVSLNGCPYHIGEAYPKGDNGAQDYSDLTINGTVIDGPKGRWKKLQVNGAELSYVFPPLGFVHTGEGWGYVHRVPQRKMTKGFCAHTAGIYLLEPASSKVVVTSESIVRQLFFGNSDRINPDIVIDKQLRVWYGVEHVLNIKEDGNIEVTENHEKMGVIVCKYLANSSVARTLVPNLILPSS